MNKRTESDGHTLPAAKWCLLARRRGVRVDDFLFLVVGPWDETSSNCTVTRLLRRGSLRASVHILAKNGAGKLMRHEYLVSIANTRVKTARRCVICLSLQSKPKTVLRHTNFGTYKSGRWQIPRTHIVNDSGPCIYRKTRVNLANNAVTSKSLVVCWYSAKSCGITYLTWFYQFFLRIFGVDWCIMDPIWCTRQAQMSTRVNKCTFSKQPTKTLEHCVTSAPCHWSTTIQQIVFCIYIFMLWHRPQHLDNHIYHITHHSIAIDLCFDIILLNIE